MAKATPPFELQKRDWNKRVLIHSVMKATSIVSFATGLTCFLLILRTLYLRNTVSTNSSLVMDVSLMEELGLLSEDELPGHGLTYNIHDAQNSTLGFQKIFVLSMPHRRDKRDMIALSTHLSGLEIEFIDGVAGSDISEQERPEGWQKEFDTDGHIEGSLGCWRGHMDIYQRMVREQIQTALILEDDVDWDVMIKDQMTEVARGSKHLQKDFASFSPYGDKWWIISTGHCSALIDTTIDQEQWVIDNDPTVVPKKHRKEWFGPDTKPLKLRGVNTRLVFGLHWMVCTGSYAVSLEGATKLLYDQELHPHAKPIDLAIGTLCQREGKGKCLGVYPPVTGIFVPAGNKSKESDRQGGNKGERNEVAWAKNLVYSTRLNLDLLLEKQTLFKSQYPEDSMAKEINTTTFKSPEGHLVTITAEEYHLEQEKEDKIKEAKEKKANEKVAEE